MHNLHNLTINVNVQELLARLRANRALHAAAVAEAIENYPRVVCEALAERRDQIMAGTFDGSREEYLSFDFPAPHNYTDVYDRVIGMLELATDAIIQITADQYANWIDDDWSWSDRFLHSNAAYSSRTRAILEAKVGATRNH
jgi:hypothetical protein